MKKVECYICGEGCLENGDCEMAFEKGILEGAGIEPVEIQLELDLPKPQYYGEYEL